MVLDPKDILKYFEKIYIDHAAYGAAKAGDFELAKFFVNHGAGVHQVLCGATQCNNMELIEWSIENGACNFYGALYHSNSPETSKFFLDKGIPIDLLNNLLSWAVLTQNIDLIKMLVEYGASDFKEAIMHARICQFQEIKEFLEEKQAQEN